MASELRESGGTRAWSRIRAAVLAEEPMCRWCGEPADCVDHIVPRKHGGDDRRDNLAGSCTPCNLTRGAAPRNAAPSRPW